VKKDKIRKIKILYGSCTGTAKQFAYKLFSKLNLLFKCNISITDLNDYDEEKMELEDIVFIICSTWTDGKPPAKANRFFGWLTDAAFDFRVSKSLLSKLNYAVFGLGGDIYKTNFCKCVNI
jgi:sulfite reductase alpha subunit-like flavoprotein